jgi:hypothetical protein
MSQDNDIIKKLPRSLFLGARKFARQHLTADDVPLGGARLPEIIGLRRINDQCIELEPYGNQVRSNHARSIGFLFSLGVVLAIFIAWIMPPPVPASVWTLLGLFPLIVATFGGVMYLCVGKLSGQFRGGFVRIHRGTRKLYFVMPHDEYLLTLEWDQLQAMAGYIPIVGAGGYTSRYPLYLLAVDWNPTPPREVCVACGNLGWRDDGDSAKQLWDCLQVFMEHGPASLPKPPPIPIRLSRIHTFLHGYREWAENFSRDLATPRPKRWAPLLIPAKILELMFVVIPDSLAEFIEYNVPYTSFPKEIDELCGFADPLPPITRACT